MKHQRTVVLLASMSLAGLLLGGCNKRDDLGSPSVPAPATAPDTGVFNPDRSSPADGGSAGLSAPPLADPGAAPQLPASVPSEPASDVTGGY